MGANIWFWLIFVIIGCFGGFQMGPWRTDTNRWGFFSGYVVCLVLIGILGIHVYGWPIR